MAIETRWLKNEQNKLLVDETGKPYSVTFEVIDGREIELRLNSDYLQWHYVGETSWKDLISVQQITGPAGKQGPPGKQGLKGDDGSPIELRLYSGWIEWKYQSEDNTQWKNLVAITELQGEKGDAGATPSIGFDGNWYIDGKDTGRPSRGVPGATPEIGENGNWFVDGEDTGKPSRGVGADGADGKSVTSATVGTVSEADGYTVTPVTFGLSDGSSLPAVPIKAKNAERETLAQNEVIDRSGNSENADADSSDFVQSNDLSIKAKVKTSNESLSVESLAGKFSTEGEEIYLTGGVASCVDTGDNIYIIGGQTAESGVLFVGTKKIIKYSKQDGSFSQTNSWGRYRGYCGVAYVPKDNSVYIVGGSESYLDSSSDTAVSNIIDCKIYKIDISTNVRTESQYSIPSSISPIYCYAYYRDLDSSIYCVSSDGSHITKFNVNTGAIDNIDISSLITPNHSNVSACCVNDKIYIFSKETSVLVYEYDLSSASGRQIYIDNVVFSGALCASSGDIHMFVGDKTYVFDTTSYSIKEFSNSGYSSIDERYTICVSDYLFFVDDSSQYSALLATRNSATYEYREISNRNEEKVIPNPEEDGTENLTKLQVGDKVYNIESGSSTPVIDLGEVTLTEQSLGNISMALASGITVTAEQTTIAQAETPCIAKVVIDGAEHEFFRTKVSTDASDTYIHFSATEDNEGKTRFYNLQIVASRTGGVTSALLYVWKYKFLDGLFNPLNLGNVTIADGAATITLTDEQNGVIGAANALQFTKAGTGEVYWLYRSQFKSGGASDAHDSDFFGIIPGADGLTAYAAYLDGTTLTIKQVAIGSGGGTGGNTPVIDLGEVTPSTMSLGAISQSFAGGIQVTLEQAAMAQSEVAPIVKIRFDNTDHEFYRTKISTDASAAYIYFAATEEMGEGSKFYNLQITVSESGGASAMLMVWKYKILEGLNSAYEARGLSFVDGTATVTITEEERGVFNEGSYNQIRFWDNSNTNEIYTLYISHSNRGASGINSHNCDYFGIVENASVTGKGGGITVFYAYLDNTTLTIKQSASGGSQEITKEQIATALGCSEEQLDTIVALAKKVTINGENVKFATGTVLQSSYFDAVD